MTWVRTEDGKPEEWKPVLLYWPDADQIVVGYYDGGGHWHLQCGNVNPSHWMPLPEKP